jgi:hypothetical protein
VKAEKKKKKKKKRRNVLMTKWRLRWTSAWCWRHGTSLSLLGTFVWVLFFAMWSLVWEGNIPDEANEWGDWAAGGAAPAAFFWLVRGYFQQSRELRIQANELRKSVQQQTALSLSAKEQTKQLAAANRPWVDFKVDLKSLSFGPGNGRVDLLAEVENAGKSPAHHIQISNQVFLVGLLIGPHTSTMAPLVRETAERTKNNAAGTTLLPGRTYQQLIKGDFSVHDLADKINRAKFNQLAAVRVALCLHYKFGDGDHGWTEKIVTIEGLNPDTQMNARIDVTKLDQDVNHLRLRVLPASPGLS